MYTLVFLFLFFKTFLKWLTFLFFVYDLLSPGKGLQAIIILFWAHFAVGHFSINRFFFFLFFIFNIYQLLLNCTFNATLFLQLSNSDKCSLIPSMTILNKWLSQPLSRNWSWSTPGISEEKTKLMAVVMHSHAFQMLKHCESRCNNTAT